MTTENNKDDRTISIKDLINIFDDPNLQGIITKYEEVCKEANKKIEFNIFRMLSDYYYRENFHGDILEVFLNPKGGHGEGDKFLNLFLQMIKKDNIKISDYEINPQLVREYRIDGNRRIDFVIESGKNCIIIENKLYDAVDQDNQLPSYVKAMEEKGKKVDAVIYLPLSAGKIPDKSTWTDDNVTPLLQIICAERLIIDWLVPCIKNSKKEDSRVILNHYKEMLGSLIPNKEKEDIMEELLQYLKDGELKKAIQIKEMLNNMPSHMELSVHEKLKTNLSGNACEKYKIEETTWSKCVVTIPVSNKALTTLTIRK